MISSKAPVCCRVQSLWDWHRPACGYVGQMVYILHRFYSVSCSNAFLKFLT